MVDDLCQGPQPHPWADGAPSLGEQGPHLSDGPSDGGAVDFEPAGEHIVRNPVSEMHEGDQKPVDEDQPVLRTRAHSTLPRPGRKLGLVPFVPQRAQLCDEFGDHVGQQARDPPVADDRCTRRVPHHTTMIDDQKLDASPLTVHELVIRARCVRNRPAQAGRFRGCQRTALVRVREGDGRARASRAWGQQRLIGRRWTGVVRLVGRRLPAGRDRRRSTNVRPRTLLSGQSQLAPAAAGLFLLGDLIGRYAIGSYSKLASSGHTAALHGSRQDAAECGHRITAAALHHVAHAGRNRRRTVPFATASNPQGADVPSTTTSRSPWT